MGFLAILFCIVLIYLGYKLIAKLLYTPQISNVESRYILVTGCDSGFGNGLAKRLDALGCHVFATCLTESGETELHKSCSQRLHTIHMDVSNSESVKKGYDKVTKILPPGKGLWGLVNNAGIIGKTGRVDWQTLDDYRKAASINLFGLIDVTMTFLPLIKKEKGRLVNMGTNIFLKKFISPWFNKWHHQMKKTFQFSSFSVSIAGRIAATTAPYTISKYGIEAFSDHLRRDMADFNVSVSIIEPSFFRTNLLQGDAVFNNLQNTIKNLPDTVKEEFGQEYFDAVLKTAKGGIGRGLQEDITSVLDAYTHALLGRFPRARYLVGKGAGVLMLIQSLPEWIGDRILRLQRKGLKPAACKNI